MVVNADLEGSGVFGGQAAVRDEVASLTLRSLQSRKAQRLLSPKQYPYIEAGSDCLLCQANLV
jgi:hypothetical protein